MARDFLRLRLSTAASLAAAVLLTLAGCAPSPADVATAETDRALALARAGKLLEAIAGFEKAIALSPDDVRARYNAGLAFLAIHRPVEAQAHLERFVALRPGDALGNYNLARAYALRQQPDRALASLQAAVTAGYANYTELTGSGGFERLHGDVRYVALEATVAQRAGIKPENLAGALGQGQGEGQTGYGGIEMPGLRLPGIDTESLCAQRRAEGLACEDEASGARAPAGN